jgi:DNA-binding HxlR family transcriptional regulator
MTAALPSSLLRERRAIRTLSLPGLIRLVSEIDDNGPISRQRGSLQGAFGDLTPGQLRHAIDTARDLGLIHARGHALARYQLTASGKDLAEVYDTAARWARTRELPSHNSDFVARVQYALQVRDGGPEHPGAATEPSAPHEALSEWFKAHPRVLHQDVARSSHAAQESGRAA